MFEEFCSFVVWCGVVWCGVVWCGALWCGTHLLRATTCTVLVIVIENKKGECGVCETLEDVVMTEPMPVSGGEPLGTA